MNRFQRWYFRWAQPYYDRMPASLRAEAERFDAWLYSRDAAGLWLGLFFTVVGIAGALSVGGMAIAAALVTSLLVTVLLFIGIAGVWLQPEKFTGRRLLRLGGSVIAGGYLGALVAFLVARAARRGGLELPTLPEDLWQGLQRATPALLVTLSVIAFLLWAVAHSRRVQLHGELARLELVRERDQAARSAAEARLKLLQAQIQPHFLFNTLAALQHWVDTGDARAGALLRSLNGFLRTCTELLARPEVTLEAEAGAVRQYLEIMQARLGARLRWTIELEPAALAQELPPGLVLTLVENAVEHGIEPALQGGEVQVRATHDEAAFVLSVRDDGAGLRQGWAEGLGLANTRERLAHRFAQRARLEVVAAEGGRGTEARVSIVRTD
jgi:hypothetical protein